MKKLALKMGMYGIFILLFLEVLVRLFNLATETPKRFIDGANVEKYIPGQKGISVTGNRRQHFAEYRINSSGFNSYRNFNPTNQKKEIALVGDSFIEGFHQNYYNSIGKKIENNVEGIEVYEYGFSGYDMADQLHLIHQYQDQFQYIDFVVLGLKYDNDLKRAFYYSNQDRMEYQLKIYPFLRKSELLVYANSIGVISNIKSFFGHLKAVLSLSEKKEKTVIKDFVKFQEEMYLDNFKSLVSLYGFDKTRFYLLIDESQTPKSFIDFLKDKGFKYIEMGEVLSNATKATTLGYDLHWNNNGRTIIANLIATYYKRHEMEKQ
jgi:hypothetical protein